MLIHHFLEQNQQSVIVPDFHKKPLDQRLGQAGTINHLARLPPVIQGTDGPGHQLFTGAGLPPQ
jgi:hypothetical protein